MCGISGLVGRADQASLRASMEAMAHRGPDHAGEWHGSGVMLGHRRLSILDISENGQQPMANEAGTVQLVFNGEIYNFVSLRRDLERRYRFRSRTDTEVVLRAYEAWGIEGLLERVSGMFAFGLWDDEHKVLHLARDRMGKKPLFYSEVPGGVAFASTLPALLPLLPEIPALRPDAVADFLHYLCVPGEKSIVEGVSKLLPGHRAELSDGVLAVQRYWGLSFAHQEHRDVEEWLDLIDAEVRAAVARRLASDVPLGVFLSGGVDSSLVTAMVAEHVPGRVTTISAGFEEASFDELPHARRVAQHLDTDHHEHVIRPSAAAILPRLVHAAGEPFGDHALVPMMQLAQAARERVTVVLTGDGGDELFAGYPGPLIGRLAGPYMRAVPHVVRERAVPALEWLQRWPKLQPTARRLLRLAVPARGRDFVWRFDPLSERGFRNWADGLFTASFAAELARRGHDADAYWRRAIAESDGATAADRVLYTETTTLLPDQFLVKADVSLMAYGLEGRSPLLDASLAELAARIPAAMKTQRGVPKYLLKRLAARYVPREAVYRRKQGLSVPTGMWLRHELAAAVSDLLGSDTFAARGIFDPAQVHRLVDDHKAGRVDHGQRLWLLLQLELWLRMFVDGTVSPWEELPMRGRAPQ